MDAIMGVALRLYPDHQLGSALAERMLGLPLQQLPRLADVRKAVADIPPAIFAHNLWSSVFVEGERQDLGNLAHGQRFARANVNRLTSHWLFGSRNYSAGYVAHVHKTTLLAVFKDQWRAVVEQADTENRRHASVWVGKRLT